MNGKKSSIFDLIEIVSFENIFIFEFRSRLLDWIYLIEHKFRLEKAMTVIINHLLLYIFSIKVNIKIVRLPTISKVLPV